MRQFASSSALFIPLCYRHIPPLLEPRRRDSAESTQWFLARHLGSGSCGCGC